MSWYASTNRQRFTGGAGWMASAYPGGGIRGSAVPATGDNGHAAPIYNDLVLPGDNNDEFAWAIVTAPAGGGTFVPYEDGSFTYTGPSTSFTYQLYENYVAVGTPATVTITVATSFTGAAAVESLGAAGSFVVAGAAISFTGAAALQDIGAAGSFVTPGASYTLAADSGSFALTGQDATLTYMPIVLPTVARPISDTSNTGWIASAGGPLFAMIDEVIADDSDYIYTTSASSVCQMALNTTAYPGAASQTFSFRASSANSNTVQARLKNANNSIVATWSQALTATPTTYLKVLTAGEIALITSGSLSLELTAL